MKKFFIALLLVMGLAGLSYAAVDVRSDSTVVGKTEKLNFVGPSVTQSGTVITVDTGTITGNTAITGTLSATGLVQFSGDTTVTGATAAIGGLTVTAGTTLTGNVTTAGTFTSSNATTLGWTLISSANTFGTSMCTNACVFCINGQGTVGDMNVGCSVATADTCLCAGAN